MATFVTFPGTAVNVSTDDVNLLDADTAHCFQSDGTWSNLANAPNVGQKAIAAAWSGFGVKADASGSGTPVVAASTVATVVGETYAVGFKYPVDGVYSYAVRLAWQTAGGNVDSAYEGVTGERSISATAPAGSTGIRVMVLVKDIDGSSTAPAGEIAAYDNVLRPGSDAEFVPSLRIVGSLFEEIDPPVMPIVFAGDGTPLTVGEGWAGDGYFYRRYDGANSLAPLVAQFSADDVPV